MNAGARALGVLCALAMLSAPSAGRSATAAATGAAPAYGANLVVNGDAEAEASAPDSSKVVKPSGWTTTGEFTAVLYGASGGFPDAKSPGPADRGKSLFEGGNVAKSTATQTIALAVYGADIDTGSVMFHFSAWLGGYSTQDDNAAVAATFEDAGGANLETDTLGPVKAAARNGITGSKRESVASKVPKGARSVVITVTITRVTGTYNDGSADDIALSLTKTP